MGATVIYGEVPAEAAGARPEGDNLWLSPSDLRAATGWELKAEGLCRDDICIPLPAGLAREVLRQEGTEQWVNLAGFSRYRGQPLAHDDGQGVWYFGRVPDEYKAALLSQEAPDFTLTGYDDREYRLSAFRGKKVLLLLWASW